MPEIFDVSNHFDDIAITDAYTGAALYNGQFSSFIGASPDGSTAQRRVMSLAPTLAIPTRRVITALTESWVVGNGNFDGIYGKAIRQSFWLKKVTALYQKLTPGQAALGTAGVAAYGHLSYLKDTTNVISSSEYDPFWDIYFSPTENITKGMFLTNGTTYYRVRSQHFADSGLTDAACDELEAGSRVSVTFTQTGAYDPITDTFTAATVMVNGIILDRYKWYERLTEADRIAAAGDMTLTVASAGVTPIVGRLCTIGSQAWQIMGIVTYQDAWELHIRRA